MRILFSIVLVSVLLSVAVSLGAVDIAQTDSGAIDTPEPLPDWPLVWELPVDTKLNPDQTPRHAAGDAVNEGEPRTSDPGSTRFNTSETSIHSETIEARIHDQINTIRSENNLSRLDHNDEIASIGRTYSYDMAERGYFSHVSPEGERPDDRLGSLYPRTCRAVGENLAYVGLVGATDADELVERIVTGWMNSKGHRENILTGRWDSQGIGVYIGDERVYATQNFCDEW
ncbi:CAP domain-containing protein [Halocatena pleomorpha]|uniref:CAP domain-containing protein n=2 Tax=Halocatena pleomorpha TaxID=1785090 RepID=A0A3P3RFA7_9EURY|nr:CAP domain-containing protein [Halocatena pleomorpha]